MSYYGDYYRGDYYRGDPGFWSTLGGIAKSVVGFIPGIGPVASGVIGAISGGAKSKMIAAAPGVAAGSLSAAGAGMALTKPGFYKGAIQRVGTTLRTHPVLTAAGAAGVAGAAAGMGLGKLGRAAGHPLGGGMRRRRRMRVTNPKALRRAIRRATGFAHLAKKVLSFTERKPHRGRAVFKKPRRSKRVC